MSHCVLFFLPDQRLYIVKNVIHAHISDCVETVYELSLLRNKTANETFLQKSERCEVLTGYLSLGRRPGCDRANT